MPRFVSFVRHYWAALVACAVIAVIVVQTAQAPLALNNGKFIYALDDAYIHMSIAKNFSQYGVWGVTRYEFASASSSPLWTGLVALTYVIFGVNEYSPLVLNILAAFALMFAINHVLNRCGVPTLYTLIVLLVVLWLFSIDRQIFMGMEHTLQPVINLLFAYQAATVLADGLPLRSRQGYTLLVLALLVGAVRYEGLFLVLAFCVLYALRGRIGFAVLIGAVSVIPLAVIGIVAMSNGWGVLPSSVLLRANDNQLFLSRGGYASTFDYLTRGTFEIVTNTPIMLTTLAAAALVFALRYERERVLWRVPTLMLIALALVVPLHARLISPNSPHMRYDAYLLPLALTVSMGGMGTFLPRRFTLSAVPLVAAGAVIALLLIQPWYDRYVVLDQNVPTVQAMHNIYAQQYQMAQFLNTYYPGAVVAANDIGAINYFADIRGVDLWGLGTLAVSQARAAGQYTTAEIDAIMQARGGQIAILFDHWFRECCGGLPATWQSVGTWRVTDSVILGSDTVTFYAVQPEEAPALAEHLREYSPRLPPAVIQTDPATTAAAAAR